MMIKTGIWKSCLFVDTIDCFKHGNILSPKPLESIWTWITKSDSFRVIRSFLVVHLPNINDSPDSLFCHLIWNIERLYSFPWKKRRKALHCFLLAACIFLIRFYPSTACITNFDCSPAFFIGSCKIIFTIYFNTFSKINSVIFLKI